MNISTRNREFLGMRRQLAELNQANVRRTDTFAGLSLLFGIVSLTVVVGGVVLRDPELAVGAGLSLTAAAVFAVSAFDLRVSRRDRVKLAHVDAQTRRVASANRAA